MNAILNPKPPRFRCRECGGRGTATPEAQVDIRLPGPTENQWLVACEGCWRTAYVRSCSACDGRMIEHHRGPTSSHDACARCGLVHRSDQD